LELPRLSQPHNQPCPPCLQFMIEDTVSPIGSPISAFICVRPRSPPQKPSFLAPNCTRGGIRTHALGVPKGARLLPNLEEADSMRHTPFLSETTIILKSIKTTIDNLLQVPGGRVGVVVGHRRLGGGGRAGRIVFLDTAGQVPSGARQTRGELFWTICVLENLCFY